MLVWAGVGTAHAQGAPEAPALFAKYCYECHGNGEKSGQIALDQMLKADPLHSNRREWEKAWKIVRQEFMPPVEADRPSDDERKAITRWIAQKALGVDYQNTDPGRITIRRLNRMEYEYSVTDLFGVNPTSSGSYSLDNKGVNAANKKLRDRLPPDDNTFGFDNNGDFMTLSPALLERYFNLAEWIVDQVILQDGPRHPILDLTENAPRKKPGPTTRSIEQSTSFELRYSGPYRLEMNFTVGEFAEISGTFEMLLSIDGKLIQRDEVQIGGHATHNYTIDLNLEKGSHTFAMATRPFDTIATTKPFINKDKPNVMDPTVRARLTGPIGTGIYEYPKSHQQIFFNGAAPDDPVARRDYAKAIIKRLADKAFRRPVDDSSLDRLTDLAMQGDTFERGVGQAITAILISPRFLFRAELQQSPDDPKSIHPIDEYALASRLSYLLWLSLPDDELKQLAGAGKLRENLEPQIRRMLADKKSSRFFEDFPGQWLRTRNVLMSPNSRDGKVLDPLRPSMKRETEMLFEDVARNDRDLLELITADYTFVNKDLAEFYGIKGVEGTNFEKVNLPPDSHRGGLLTQASFLVSTSNPNRTSPVKRGLFVLDTFWGITPPPPLPNVPSLEDAKDHGVTPKTVREQLAVHRADPKCAACHAHFDPIGVALENFDLIGRWRDTEAGEKIQPHEETITGETLSGVEDIRKLFVSRPGRFYRGITEKMLTYAIGRGLQPSDSVTVDRIADELVTSHGKFSTLLMGIVTSPEFQLRRGDDGVPVEHPRIVMPAPPTPEQIAQQRQRRRAAIAAEAAGGTAAPPAVAPATPPAKSEKPNAP
ncbi:MAG TPA: DUF1592 domain-containing protein [Tepidisphaeraceae bacterium]